MADISKINPNGTEYNLKDATARNAIQSTKTLKSSVVTVNDAAPINAEDITVDITPQQDLHGYDRPWAGGAGKNLLALTVDGIKAAAFNAAWVGYKGTIDGVEFEILTDSDNNVTGISVTRVAASSETVTFNLVAKNSLMPLVGKSVIMNGVPSTANPDFYLQFYLYDGTNQMACTGEQTSAFTPQNFANSTVVRIVIRTNTNPNKAIFTPMIRLATETDATFAPYSNICPIEGRTGAELDRVGKNELPMTLDILKSLNTGGTWSGNIYSRYGTTFTVLTNSDNRVLGIQVAGTPTNEVSMILNFTGRNNVNYILSGCPSGGSSSSYRIDTFGTGVPNTPDYGSGATFTASGNSQYVRIIIKSGYAIQGSLLFYPMIRLSTETDATYEPYQGEQYTASFGETVYGGKWHVTAGGTDKTHGNIASYNGETINEPWLSSMDEYSPAATPTTGAQVVYPLTTPTTISTPKQNVPMLQGINTVYADCGDVSLKYQPDNVIGELKGEIEDSIIYEDFKWTTESSQSYSAGTPGTYGTSSWRDVKKEGYDVIGVTFVENRLLGDSILTLNYIPSTSRVEVIVFRATSSSKTIADEDIAYRVAYKKRT